MAAYDITRSYAVSGSAARIGAVIVNILSAFGEWNDARLTRKSLSSLSDRELDDIGLHRGDIDAVAGRY
jgi:uncharacterized protein YjiS (DUF1127 family)